jgi:hypothetical protein
MKPYLQPSCVVRVWSLLAWLAIATGSAWAQNNCGVSVDFSYVGKDTIQQQPLTERCIYRVTLVNTRNDVFEVRVKPQNTSTTSLSLTNGSAAIVAGSAPPSYSWFYSGNVPFPTGNTYLGPLYVTGPAPQVIDVEFINANQAVICKAMLDGQCESGGGVASGNPCLVQNITVNTGYNPVTGSVISVTPTAFDPNWIVVSDPFPKTNEPRPAGVINKHPAWANPLPGSQWIAVYNSYSNSTNGIYVFKRCFCIEGPTRAIVDLKVLADDIVDSILVCGKRLTNRTPNYTHHWFKSPPRVFRDTLNLLGGSCCIEVYVRNTHSVAFGLDIAGSIQLLHTQGSALIADTCCRETKCWIIGQKFHDLNCNGTIDQGEPALQGWQINATSGPNTYSATTGSDGWYAIQVPPGTYTINEVPKPGFQQSAGGPFIVTLSQGKVVQYDFLNCTAPPPCDTIGEVHLDSACCQFTIPIFLAQGQGISGVTSIQWSLSGGTMASISPLMGCPFTLTPTNPTTGTITFTPACTVSPLNLGMAVIPTTATGQVTLYLTINHGPNKVCRDTIRLKCARAPITKCDSLSVAPYIFQNLQQSWRTFTITNLKQPTSPIKEVKIALTPPPCTPTYVWNGGGLVVDGNSRSWGYTSSGTPPYSTVSMSCPPGTSAPQGLAANGTVTFNLGVDYTCNWTGTVTLTVIHCDGDTCTLTANWCAKENPKLCLISTPVDVTIGPATSPLRVARIIEVRIDTMMVPGNRELRACHATVVPISRGWDVVGVSIEDELTQEERESGRYRPWIGGVKLTKADAARWALVELQPCKQDTTPIKGPWILRATLASREQLSDTPRVAVTFYDADGNPIASDTARAMMQVTSVPVEIVQPGRGSSGILQIVPNPAAEEVQVEYVLAHPGEVTVELCDLLGKCRLKAELGWMPSGRNTFGMSTADVPTGSYSLRLRTSDGVLTAPLRVVR